MKKLIFGLLTTVLLSSLSYGKSLNQLPKRESIEIANKDKGIDNFVAPACVHVSISLGNQYGSVGADGYICCWRASAHENKWDCGFFSSIPTIAFNAYLDVESLDKKTLDLISKGDTNKVKISNSQLGEIEGKFFKVLDGEYIIEKDENGRFIKVKMVEVVN